jgi:hypothetical protein
MHMHMHVHMHMHMNMRQATIHHSLLTYSLLTTLLTY